VRVPEDDALQARRVAPDERLGIERRPRVIEVGDSGVFEP